MPTRHPRMSNRKTAESTQAAGVKRFPASSAVSRQQQPDLDQSRNEGASVALDTVPGRVVNGKQIVNDPGDAGLPSYASQITAPEALIGYAIMLAGIEQNHAAVRKHFRRHVRLSCELWAHGKLRLSVKMPYPVARGCKLPVSRRPEGRFLPGRSRLG